MPRSVTPTVTPKRLTTARSVEALKPKASRYVVPDTDVKGLELRVLPSGAKVWTLRYRVSGQQRRLKLGVYSRDRLTLSKAREQANRKLRKIDDGIDPRVEQLDAKQAAEQAKRDSIGALCDAYLRDAERRKRTWRTDRSIIKREILSRWKGRPVSSITRRDCRELLKEIHDRGAPIFANRVGALLSRLFRFAVDEEVIDANPASHLPKLGVEAASRPEGESELKAYTPDEIRTMWAATEELPAAASAIYRLGLLTGQRPSEISDLEWSEVDGSWWSIPGGRTKNGRDHRVWLSPLALKTLADIPQVRDEPHVFAGYRGKRQLAAMNRVVFADVRSRKRPRHAMRDTVASGLARCGVAVEVIAHVLNHTYGPTVTRGYVSHRYDAERKRALTRWSRELTKIIEGTEGAKVVPFSRS